MKNYYRNDERSIIKDEECLFQLIDTKDTRQEEESFKVNFFWNKISLVESQSALLRLFILSHTKTNRIVSCELMQMHVNDMFVQYSIGFVSILFKHSNSLKFSRFDRQRQTKTDLRRSTHILQAKTKLFVRWNWLDFDLVFGVFCVFYSIVHLCSTCDCRANFVIIN